MSNPAPSPDPATGGALSLQRNNAGRWMRWLPGVATLREYQRSWLRHDLVAGLVLVTMLVPVGIAYAVASGVPGVYGLYATIVPLLAYAVFGPSRILVLGPDSSLAPIILAVVVAHSGGDPMRAIALAGAMAIVSGVICILAGVLRLGFITELFSKPIRYGYMNGIALTVLISQLPKLFGFSVEADGPLRSLWAIGEAVWTGRTNWTAFLLGVATLATILLLKGNKRLPGVLIAVIGATLVASVFDLSARAGVAVLGKLPEGLPVFGIPWIGYADLEPVLIGGVAVALVSFADTSVLSRPTPRASVGTSIPTRRWWAWEPPISPRVSSRAFRSAAARHARLWRKRPARRRRPRASSARWAWRRCSSRLPISCVICQIRPWPPLSSPRRSG